MGKEPEQQIDDEQWEFIRDEVEKMKEARAQRLRKAILAALYVYPAYIEYRRKFGAKMKTSKTLASHQGC